MNPGSESTGHATYERRDTQNEMAEANIRLNESVFHVRLTEFRDQSDAWWHQPAVWCRRKEVERRVTNEDVASATC